MNPIDRRRFAWMLIRALLRHFAVLTALVAFWALSLFFVGLTARAAFEVLSAGFRSLSGVL